MASYWVWCAGTWRPVRDRSMPMAQRSSLNPWLEKGTPLEKQYRSWKRIVPEPYDKRDVDAYTRARVILMNGIEQEVWVYSHTFARCTDNLEIKALLAMTRRAED